MNHLETSRMDRFFCSYHPPPKYNRNNIFSHFWPFTLYLIFSHHASLWTKEHVSLASKRYWVRWWVFRWKPFLVSVFNKPPCLVPALLNFVLLSSSWQHTCSSQVYLAYVKCWTPAYTWLSCSPHIQRRNGCEKHRGVHRERHESLFFTANFKENFSTVCMRDFFFLKKICTHGDKPKCTVP